MDCLRCFYLWTGSMKAIMHQHGVVTGPHSRAHSDANLVLYTLRRAPVHVLSTVHSARGWTWWCFLIQRYTQSRAQTYMHTRSSRNCPGISSLGTVLELSWHIFLRNCPGTVLAYLFPRASPAHMYKSLPGPHVQEPPGPTCTMAAVRLPRVR